MLVQEGAAGMLRCYPAALWNGQADVSIGFGHGRSRLYREPRLQGLGASRIPAGGFRQFVARASRGRALGPLIEGDLADRNRLVVALETYQVAAVTHLAAYAYVGESVLIPQCTTATTSETAYR